MCSTIQVLRGACAIFSNGQQTTVPYVRRQHHDCSTGKCVGWLDCALVGKVPLLSCNLKLVTAPAQGGDEGIIHSQIHGTRIAAMLAPRILLAVPF